VLNVLWGIFGVTIVLGIAFLFSNNKKNINWRTIIVGVVVNTIFAFLILKWSFGRFIFQKITSVMNTIVDNGQEGIMFLFGELFEEGTNIKSVTAISIVSMIVFFASLVAVLYHLGIMQKVVKYLGGAIAKLFGTTNEESTSAAANIFLGHTEAPLVIRPFLSRLKSSELFAVMTGGLASTAGTMLALYATLGVEMKYLLIASFMSASSGLVLAKMFFPAIETTPYGHSMDEVSSATETDSIQTNEKDLEERKSENVVDAAQKGAVEGMHIGLAVAATLLALVSIIAMINGFLGVAGGWFNIDLSMELIFGYVFAPITFAIGVPWPDAIMAGTLVGEKFVLTEVFAFDHLMENVSNLNGKTVAIMSIALCGFANFASMGSLISMLGGVASNRKKEIAQMAFRSVIAGALASLLSASIAGMFL